MSATIANLLARIRRDHASLGITLYPPATETELLAFEQYRGIRLPNDLRVFYHCCNGFELNRELFRFIPLAENSIPNYDNYLLAPHDFHLAEDIFYADIWTLATQSVASQEYSIYNAREERTLTTSFTEFLEVALKGVCGSGGLYDWEKQLEPQPAPLSILAPTQNIPASPRRPWYKFWH